MSEESISLAELLNLAIAVPHASVVNFKALHALFNAVLQLLDIQEQRTPWKDTQDAQDKQQQPSEEEQQTRITKLDQEVAPGFELQLQIASSSSPTTSGSSSPKTSRNQSQGQSQSQSQTYDDAVAKAVKLIEELHNQKDNLDKELKKVYKANKVEAGTESDVDKCCHRLDVLEEAVRSIMDEFDKYPDAEELSQCVTWDEMHSVLLSGREDLEKEVGDPVTADTEVKRKRSSKFPKAAPFQSSTPSSSHPVDNTVRPAASPSPPISGQILVDARMATEAPSVLSGPKGAPSVLPGPKGAPSVLSGPKGAPSVLPGPKGAPSVLSGPTGAPSVLSGPTEAPSVLSGPTGAPSVLSGPTEAPSVLSGPTGAPSVLSEPTGAPSPSVLSGPTGAPSPSVLSGPTEAPSPSVLSGPTGAPSPSVLSGPTGAPSPSVLSGPTGAPSPSVLSGPTEVPSPSVLSGPTGAHSVQSGPTGVPSPSVQSGPTGAPSHSVLSGSTGAPSASVLSGPTGAPSPSVLSGPTGAPSPSVLSGPTGAPSPSVLSGPTGAPSPSVLSGPTGAPSPSVPSGPTGAPSPSVPSGPTGAPSPSVLSGPTGVPSPSVLSGPTGAPSPSVLSRPTGAPSVLSGPTGQTNTRLTAAGTPQTHKAKAAELYSETVEALRGIGKMKERFNKLEACVAAVEEGMVDRSQLKQLIANKDSFDESNNVMDQLNQLRALVNSLMSDREKDKFMNLTSPDREATSEAASGSKELKQPKFDLRIVMQKLEEDATQLKDKQALTVGKTTDRELQDQIDDLRGMLDDVMQSLTSQLALNRSEVKQDESDDSQSLTSLSSDRGGQRRGSSLSSDPLGQRKERSASGSSIVETSRRLSILFQHYEQLQDSVNSLLQQQTRATAGPLKDRENVELGSDVKEDILQLQTKCEKLHETTKCLQDDNRQKQSHIEELYKTTEELQENLLWIEQERVKQKNVDKSDKVSCLQFDSAIEQLYAMFHEVLNKVTGQEQDWHKVIDRISTEMECKLNRIELESVKKQLEGRWKSIQQKLRTQEAPQHEGAAGIRRQLVAGFHCLSCDRPVVMHTFGPRLVNQPTSGFPSRKSIKPKQIYKLSDYSHLPASRNSGGSHTVTSASQRRSGLFMNPHTQTDMPGIIQSEVDILGQDGNIYKGRLYSPAIRNTETKLPTISSKDGGCKTKDMAKRPQSHKPAVSPGVHRPQSAHSSRSVTSSTERDWPMSALGCTSRNSLTPASPAAESNTESHADETLNL